MLLIISNTIVLLICQIEMLIPSFLCKTISSLK